MNANCRSYALPSLCMSVLPKCKTPEETNHMYFLNKMKTEPPKPPPLTRKSKKTKKKSRTKAPPSSTTTTSTTIKPQNLPQPEDIVEPTQNFMNGNEFKVIEPSESFTETPLRRRKRHLSNTRQFFTHNNEHDILKIKNSYPPTRASENVMRICRRDCELLENELCQKEYAIAKRHPTIGMKLPLEDCWDLPEDEDCMKMGVTIDISPEGQ